VFSLFLAYRGKYVKIERRSEKMTTPISDITDLFMARIQDYKLDNIFSTSGSLTLASYSEPWLLDSIGEFEDFCDQSLTYIVCGSATEGYFEQDLNMKNKLILSKFMVKYWLQKEINNSLQMSLHITDRDFKTFSAAQNLKAKQDYLCGLKEELSQDIIDYAYKRNNWDNWANQNFTS
jgi:hypothetical protein